MIDHTSDNDLSPGKAIDLPSIEQALAREGMLLLGGFTSVGQDGLPSGVKTVLIVANAGSAMWHRFQQSPEFQSTAPDPMNRWSQRVLDDIATSHRLQTAYPFDGPPWQPFQRWAKRADPRLASSPLGMLIHPDFGLWWALRGALLSEIPITLPKSSAGPPPCETCEDRPCLTACPVGAFSDNGYNVERCTAHIRAPAGMACMGGSCLARRACPIGRDKTYVADHAAFHMRAFSNARPSS